MIGLLGPGNQTTAFQQDCAELFGIEEAECFAGDSFKFEKRAKFFVGANDEPFFHRLGVHQQRRLFGRARPQL
jgi:hypothetical protein